MRPGYSRSTDLAQLLDEVVRLRLALAVALLALVEVRDGVEPQAVDAHVEPELDDVDDRLAHRRVLEVQVGLVGEEAVEVELPAHGVERPVRVLGVDEDDADVGVLLIRVAPDVEVPVRPLRVAAGLLEPLVVHRGVVQREVHDDPHVALVRTTHEVAELVDRAELGQHPLEVRDVVAAVAERRHVEGRQPEAVDAEPLQVVQARGEAAEVAGAVAVRVDEAADHHLVEDRPLVPEWVPRQTGQLDRGGEAHRDAVLPNGRRVRVSIGRRAARSPWTSCFRAAPPTPDPRAS